MKQTYKYQSGILQDADDEKGILLWHSKNITLGNARKKFLFIYRNKRPTEGLFFSYQQSHHRINKNQQWYCKAAL